MFDATVVAIYIFKIESISDDIFGYNIHLELQNVDPYILVIITW